LWGKKRKKARFKGFKPSTQAFALVCQT